MIKTSTWKLLLPIILAGVFLRVNGIMRYGLWGDEQASMQCATGQRYVVDTISTFTNIQLRRTDNLNGVVRSTIHDNGNSVLYNMALHCWLSAFGCSDLAARSLSLLLGICIIPAAFRFAKVLTGNLSTAYLSAVFIAFHPLVVGYAQEARGYSMALLFSLLSSLFLIEGMCRKVAWTKYFFFWSVTLIAALLSHYLVVYVLGAQLVIATIWLKEKRKWKALGTALVVVSVTLGLWFLVGGAEGFQVLRDQNRMHVIQAEAYKLGDPPYALPASLQNVATGMVQTGLHVFGNRIQDMGFRIREIGVLLLIPLLLIAGLVAAIRRRQPKEARPMFMLLAFIGAQSVFAVAASVRTGHCLAFLPQYALFVVPYAMVLLALSVAEVLGSTGRYKSIMIVTVIAYGLVCLIGLQVTYSNPLGKFPVRNEALAAARNIEADYAPDDTVLVRSRMEARSINIYFSTHSPIIQKIDTSLPVIYSIVKPH
jgi:uncharacterized membrane protein